jgi:hypothetical protein
MLSQPEARASPGARRRTRSGDDDLGWARLGPLLACPTILFGSWRHRGCLQATSSQESHGCLCRPARSSLGSNRNLRRVPATADQSYPSIDRLSVTSCLRLAIFCSTCLALTRSLSELIATGCSFVFSDRIRRLGITSVSKPWPPALSKISIEPTRRHIS